MNSLNDISIRLSQAGDIQNIVEMSYQKRKLYEKAQPNFGVMQGIAQNITSKKSLVLLSAN